MPTWIARRAVPWVWKKVPWKTVWAITLWLAQKGRDRVQDNLTPKEQSDFWALLKKSHGSPEQPDPPRPVPDEGHRRQSDPRLGGDREGSAGLAGDGQGTGPPVRPGRRGRDGVARAGVAGTAWLGQAWPGRRG